ncbi:sce7725 family protein [Vibrio antiquarius]
MYLPYLRGKQFELIAVRELAQIVSSNVFKPIIEPVRDNLTPLFRTLDQLDKAEITPIIVINPTVGDLTESSSSLLQELSGKNHLPCIVVRNGDIEQARKLIRLVTGKFVVQICDGIDHDALELARDAELTIVDEGDALVATAALEKVVLLRDSFKKQKRNADYGKESSFPSPHKALKFSPPHNVIGFSDYTVIGSEYSESGGPAYVVTIHLSYIDYDRFDSIFVRHYSSKDDGTPTNPAGKFIEALNKLIADYEGGIFYESSAIEEYKKLHANEHFPGLGQVKKLSIKHHVETVCTYLEGE